MQKISRKQRRKFRHKRVRAKIFGRAERPRLCIFRSNKHIYAQLIDDEKGRTLAVASDLELKKQKTKSKKPKTKKPSFAKATESKEEKRTGKIAIAFEIGKLIAQKALKMKIEKIVFDRGGYKYHGKVKSLAEGTREGGLKF